ncbi:hypothetical protein DJ71_17165 [Halorubrum sp. E3]|nr:hypothetical protein DJ71_17165 [Halorubrum sp. E3]
MRHRILRSATPTIETADNPDSSLVSGRSASIWLVRFARVGVDDGPPGGGRRLNRPRFGGEDGYRD